MTEDAQSPTPDDARARQAQKMETMGFLAAGIAHDFNNLLTVINGYSDMLLTSGELSEKAHQCAAIIRDAGARAADLTRRLVTFSRRTPVELRPVYLHALVGDTAAILRRLLPPNIELRVVSDPDQHPVLADPCGLEQVLLNLVVNSRDAMPGGGAVEIEAMNLVMGADRSKSAPYLREGNYVRLTVRDTGAGMDEETRRRISEPFYSTKTTGSGAGIGFSIVQNVISQIGGFVEVESAQGKGTEVRIYLPASEEDQSQGVTEPKRATRGGHETILLAAENGDLRELLSTQLRGLGYTVLAAGWAAAAWKLSESHKNGLNLLVTDVVLPDSEGRVLARRVRQQRPGLPVLYLCGYHEEGDCRQSAAGEEFLAKPFDLAAFGERVRSILDRRKKGRVLFVDDDPELVMFASRVLRDAGYEVLVGANGDVAIKTVEVEPLDLVITDLVMREREGLETIMRLRRSHPKLPIIAISGAFGGHFLKSAAALGARATLAKPFSGEELLTVVRGVLGN